MIAYGNYATNTPELCYKHAEILIDPEILIKFLIEILIGSQGD